MNESNKKELNKWIKNVLKALKVLSFILIFILYGEKIIKINALSRQNFKSILSFFFMYLGTIIIALII